VAGVSGLRLRFPFHPSTGIKKIVTGVDFRRCSFVVKVERQFSEANPAERPVQTRNRRSNTMRFMMLMIPKGYENATPGTMPEAKAVEAMMKYNEELQKAGVLLALDGLHPPSMGARVTFAGGKPKVTDGPFAEAKEVLGGYWMIQAKSKEEAVEWATRCPAGENEIIEVRQVQEMEDFPADVQAAAAGFEEMQAQQKKGA
jgi:hypothetical protein